MAQEHPAIGEFGTYYDNHLEEDALGEIQSSGKEEICRFSLVPRSPDSGLAIVTLLSCPCPLLSPADQCSEILCLFICFYPEEPRFIPQPSLEPCLQSPQRVESRTTFSILWCISTCGREN